MKILGISHDLPISSVCVTIDGRVVSAIPEERLDRIKQSRTFPVRAIKQCLKEAGLELASIDEIAISWNPSLDLESLPVGYLTGRRWRTEHLMQVPAHFIKNFATVAADPLTQTGIKNCPPITYVNHYLAHAGNAVFLSPFDECAALILDGRGEKQTQLVATYSGGKFTVIDEVFFPHSMGLLYGTVTEFLGFRPDVDEWKVMALAAFAKEPNPYISAFRELIRVDDSGKFELNLPYFQFYNYWDRRMYSDLFVKTFGPPRGSGEAFNERHHALASALQLVFEESVAKICTAIHKRTNISRLVAAGGCFMNSVFNGKIETLTPFKEAFVSSCPDDSGTSVGAAL
jgi:carbamoyltransferase